MNLPEIFKKEEINEFIKVNLIGILYFSGATCCACDVIKEKVLHIIKDYNKVKFLEVNAIENKEIAGWIIDSSQTTAHFNVLKYELGADTREQRINEFAPQYFVSEKTDFSKMLLIFYENDMCCRYEQNMLFYKSILAFNEQANIVYKVLSGGHCRGSSEPNEDGKYDYVETMLQWLKN